MSRAAAGALLAAAAGSFAATLETPGAWGFVVAAFLSMFWRPGVLSPRLVGLAKRLMHLALTLMGLLAWVLVVYPVMSAPTLRVWSLALGYALGALGSLFVLTKELSPREGAVPAAIGLLVISSFDLEAGTHFYLAVAGGAGFLYLASDMLPARSHRRWARTILMGGFGVVCAAAASFIVLALPWTQGKVEETMLAAYAPGSDSADGRDHRRLGNLHNLKLSKKVVMRVFSERPQKLRSGVLVRFDGTGWHRDPRTVRTLAPMDPANLGASERAFLDSLPGRDFVPNAESLAGQRLIRTEVLRVDGSGLATPGGSHVVRAPVESVQVDLAGVVLSPPRTPVRWYAVLHDVDHRKVQGGLLEAGERESSLQLPEGLDPRIRELGAGLVQGQSTPERAVETVVAHLRDHYGYSLEVGEVDRQDPLAGFLFRKKEGWCEYFATAAAILLRTQGIPTRYVSGFNVIGSQRKGGYYLVRDWDRHAWIEAYIEGKGWIEYDPTPAAEYESLSAGGGEGFWTEGVEWVSVRLASLYVRLRHLDGSHLAAPGAGALGLALAAYAVMRFVRHRRRATGKLASNRAPRSPPTGLEPLVAKLDRRAAEVGHPRKRATAPLEHWRSVPEDRLSGDERKAGIRILERFYRARFGGVPLGVEEAKELARALESSG